MLHALRHWWRQRRLRRYPISDADWQAVLQRLPILDGLQPKALQRLRERSALFLLDKHLTCLGGLQIDPLDRLCLSTQCGFASTQEGNKLTEDQQWAKIALVQSIAKDVWGE